ncbi:MAG: zinc-binding dehydrogenase [Spirochaetaceae bacterium]
MDQLSLIFPSAGKASFENRSIPELQPGECLVRNTHTMISPGTELALFTGSHIGFSDPEISWARYPVEPGYAAIGEVVDRRSVSGPEEGTRVLYYGAHARYGVLEPDAMVWTTVPSSTPQDDEGLSYLPLRFAQIALTAVIARARESRHVLIYGAGIVGNLCAQLFGYVPGVKRRAVADLSPERLAIARECGISDVLQPEDVPRWIDEATEGAGPDTVIEATGAPAVVGEALERVARGGQVVLLGSTRGTVELNVYKHIHRKLVALIGSHESLLPGRGADDDSAAVHGFRGWLSAGSQQQALSGLAEAVSSGMIRTRPFVREVIAPPDVQTAYEGLRDHPEKHLGVCIDWRES